MSYKTVIIIDNTCELTTYNQQIIKETIKCFLRNIDREDKVAIAVTGEKAEYLTDYEDSLNTQLKTVEELQFQEVNAPGVDVLMEVILDWKESDVAYRDIVYVSCKNLAIGSDYSEEELLFEINNKQYPIYTLACAQNDNTSVLKGMSSLSRISGGVSISTAEPKSDAEVEKQLSDMLINAMKERRRLEQEEDKADEEVIEYSEDNINTELEEMLYEENDIEPKSGEPIKEEADSTGVIYDIRNEKNDISNDVRIMYPIVFLVIIMLLFSLGIFIRRIKKNREDENNKTEFKDNLKRKMAKKPFEDALTGDTVCLSSLAACEEDTGTRILYQTKEGVDITLEDRADPTKYFRVCVRDSIVIGRNNKMCDIPITYDDSVSSRHCEIYQREGVLFCRDLNSANGTMINQQKIYQEIKIESGDILRIGRLSFFVQILGE